MSDACPVCNTELRKRQPNPEGRDGTFYSCPLCGDFFLSGSLIVSLPNYLHSSKDATHKISHAIRVMQNNNEVVELNTATIQEIDKQPLPTPKEQADLLLRWLAKNQEGPGEMIDVAAGTHRAVIGAKSEEGFELIIEYLLEQQLIKGELLESYGSSGKAEITLSMQGWVYVEELLSGKASYRKAFMAMKFGDQQLNEILESVFKPCVKEAGFELFKLDDKPKAGLIDNMMRVEIQSSDFIIADLSHDNLGAYWEAGYAEGLGKPVIYTCEKSKFKESKTHFDTNHHLTIIWDMDSPNEAGEQLKATIRATLPQLAKLTDK